MASEKTCGYHDDHDEDLQPAGSRCGQPATHIIYWSNGRYSYGCTPHVQDDAIDEMAREQILDIIPLDAR